MTNLTTAPNLSPTVARTYLPAEGAGITLARAFAVAGLVLLHVAIVLSLTGVGAPGGSRSEAPVQAPVTLGAPAPVVATAPVVAPAPAPEPR